MQMALAWVECSAAFICLLICLYVSPLDISITDAASVTNLDIDMVHNYFWNPFYFGFCMLANVGLFVVYYCFLLLDCLAYANSIFP